MPEIKLSRRNRLKRLLYSPKLMLRSYRTARRHDGITGSLKFAARMGWDFVMLLDMKPWI